MVDEIDIEEGEGEEEEAYVTYDIAAYPADYTLSVVHEMWKSGDIVVPDFQRNFVWTIRQSSALIESFLMGLPVPQAFFYVESDNKALVIDGLQRIMSVVYYLEGYFGEESIHGKKLVFRLAGLSRKSPYAKKNFEELDEPAQRKLRNSVLRVINIRQLGPRNDNTSAYHIFERLNTGGTPLTSQEIRNCVFHGNLVSVLRELNSLPDWRKILGKNEFDKHQKDVELILRVFALTYRFDSYEKPMKEFLNVAMKEYRDGDSFDVREFAFKFSKVCAFVVESLGEKSFHIRGRINASALDSIMATLITNADHLPPDLADRYQALIEDNSFKEATYYGTSDVAVLRTRFAVARNVLIG